MNFQYTAYTQDKTIIKGTMDVAGQDIAIEMLERAGYRVLSLKRSRKVAIEEILPSLFAVKKTDLVLFSRQLSMLMEKGVRFLTALHLVKAQIKNRLFKRRVNEIIVSVESGNTFSDSVARYPDIFPVTYRNMMKVGEKSGKLENVLREVADTIEAEETSRKKIKSALIYPGLILTMGIVTIVIMITTVLPSMKDLFLRFDAELPLPTRITLALADFLTAYGLYVLGLIFAIILFLIWYSRTARGKYSLEKFILRIPVVGRMIFLRNLQQFSRIASILLGSGLSILEVIDVARQGVQSEGIRRELEKIPGYLLQGLELSHSMRESKLFPAMLVQMVITGEETNTLESSFQALSETYEFEFSQSLSTFTSLLQPVLVAIVGLLIGFIVISAMMPMFSLYDVVF